MPQVDDLAPKIHPPEPYSIWWLVAGVVLIGLAVGAAWVAKRIWESRHLGASKKRTDFEKLKDDYLDRCSQLNSLWDAGQLETPALALKLSLLVREFVGMATDTPVDSLTLAELRTLTASPEGITNRQRVSNLVALVSDCYAASFAAQTVDGPALVDRAERVITEWQ